MAVTVANVAVVTWFVVTANDAVDSPADTPTLAGIAIGPMPESVTTVPPAGATVFSVTVAWVDTPPAMLLGVMVKSEIVVAVGASKLIPTCVVVPFNVACIAAAVVLDTVDVCTGTLTTPTPAGTVTLAGTVTAGLLLASETTMPPGAAGRLNITRPTSGVPPCAVERFTDILAME